MALISELIVELSVMSGVEKSSIAVVARHLREAGLLSQKGRGRGAAHASALDAARLCIALMVDGKAKDAPEAVRDFGRLVCESIDTEPEHPSADINLTSLCNLELGHTFEQGLAGLIEAWSDEAAVAVMEARRGPHGIWPGMLARIHDSTLTAEIYFGVSHYVYHHAALLAARNIPESDDPPGSEEWFATLHELQEQTGRYQAVSGKYFSGIRSSREISGVEIMPLGEVVAGDRPAGYRESDKEFAQQMLERERALREADKG